MNLVEKADELVGHGLGDKIEWLFRNLGLPIPQEGEFMFTDVEDEERFQVFLERFGVTVKVDRSNERHTNEHPLILKPVAQFRISVNGNRFYDVEILPGVKVGLVGGIAGRDMHYLYDELENARIFGVDLGKLGNEGYFPNTQSDYFPNGIPIVIDRKATLFNPEIHHYPYEKQRFPLDRERELAMVHKYKHGEPGKYAFKQYPVVVPLTNSFTKAWPNFDQEANPRGMELFWKICAGMKRKGLIVDGWNEKDNPRIGDDPKAKAAHTYSAKYEEHLAEVLKRVRAV